MADPDLIGDLPEPQQVLKQCEEAAAHAGGVEQVMKELEGFAKDDSTYLYEHYDTIPTIRQLLADSGGGAGAEQELEAPVDGWRERS